MKANDLLRPGESALAVFTRDMHLTIHKDGTGTSGHWRVDPDRLPDKLTILNRPAESTLGDILVANIVGSSPSPEPHKGRTLIHFSNMSQAGSTELGWFEFAGGSQNPVRYLQGPPN